MSYESASLAVTALICSLVDMFLLITPLHSFRTYPRMSRSGSSRRSLQLWKVRKKIAANESIGVVPGLPANLCLVFSNSKNIHRTNA